MKPVAEAPAELAVPGEQPEDGEEAPAADEQEPDAGTEVPPEAAEHVHSETCDCDVDPPTPLEQKPATRHDSLNGCPPLAKLQAAFMKGKRWFLNDSIRWKDPHGWMAEGPATKVLSIDEALGMGIDANERVVWILGTGERKACEMKTGRVHLTRMVNSSVKVDLELQGNCRLRPTKSRVSKHRMLVAVVDTGEPRGCSFLPGQMMGKASSSTFDQLPAEIAALVEAARAQTRTSDRCDEECRYSWFKYGNRFEAGAEGFTVDAAVTTTDDSGRKTKRVCRQPQVNEVRWKPAGNSDSVQIFDDQMTAYLGALKDESGPQVLVGINSDGLSFYSTDSGESSSSIVDLYMGEDDQPRRAILKWPCRE